MYYKFYGRTDRRLITITDLPEVVLEAFLRRKMLGINCMLFNNLNMNSSSIKNLHKYNIKTQKCKYYCIFM